MGKLHELLAVEPTLRKASETALQETLELFNTGAGRLIGSVRTYQPLEDGGEGFQPEIKVRATAVDVELEGAATSWVKYTDAALQKEMTNTGASAEISINGTEIPLSATSLLNLESRLAELRRVYGAIPTLDPAQQWEYDDDLGVFESIAVVTYKTEKRPRAFTLADATEEHPAQVEMYSEMERIGAWTGRTQSGMLSVTEKRTRLQRLDDLILHVRQARQRANDTEADNIELGASIVEYINNGID